MLPLQPFYEEDTLELLDVNQDKEERKLHCILQSKKASSQCPNCGQLFSRKHSRYCRHVKDLPFIDYKVELQIIVRKFFCNATSCKQQIFTERGLNLLESYGRRTARMDKTLRSIAFSTSAEQGSRLSKQLDVPVSAAALLRLIRKTSLHSPSPSDAVGIDEWAYLKRHRYGVLICDLYTRRPIALLEEFSADAVRQWMSEHKNVRVVSRDGSLKFKQAIQESDQNITQVTDRWHLVHNFNERTERILPQVVGSRIPIPRDDSQPSEEHQPHSSQTDKGKQKEQLMDQVKE
ncbi:zinc-finger of transposase IS204/IS1001/IS1096/IS1165 [Alteribacillus persepolensis]|uniref:Zinc-finger of transposase IS204/IS1001/IS1096/IS1165 n=1 Tax=Alteribacillus persepolensis TaxID=568899 RepID=A0A1G8EI62_9BACI|nr:transposase [Alteribacillus persepolensis]SDH69531.1 zinc-finger of transposase IS204/IS1001/IS1096/IS1165 [Alteribacillus persepolensis]